jgi:hypothetical protein
MKKLLFLLVLTFAAYTSSFAQATGTTCTQPGTTPCEVTDCSNPSNGFVVTSGTGQGTYTCGYSDSPTNSNKTICPFIYNGGTYTRHTIFGCRFSSGAPINSGLIFLIIAGAGLGAFMIRKKQQSNLSA